MSILELFGNGVTSGNDGNKNHLKNVVLVDVSYFAQRTFHGQYKSGEKVTHVSMRYTLLMTLLHRFEKLGIKATTHEIILCYDGRRYWKKVVAPYYKCRRKDKPDDRKDWDGFREHMESVRNELIKYYPFMVLQFTNDAWYDRESDKMFVSGIEADDVIGVLAKRFSEEGRNVMVMTGDGDFTQLDYLDKLTIYDYDSNIVKPEHGCGAFDLIHKIVNGDAKDDVANIYMRSDYWDTKVDGERQTSAKKLARECCKVEDPLSILNEEQKARYIENRTLKDFNYIPRDLVDCINQRYDDYVINGMDKIYDLFYDLQVEESIIQDNLKRMIMGIYR